MWYEMLFIFLAYSFFGWLAESIVAITKRRKIVNRGILNGPLCIVYGVAAVILTFGFSELQDSIVFLFVACAAVCSVVEWSAGKILEKCNYTRWWDYSDRKWNLDGYICLKYSVIWGALGVVSIKFVNPLLTAILNKLPQGFVHVCLLAILILLIIDALGSYFIIKGISSQHPQIGKANHKLTKYSLGLYSWLEKHIDRRIHKAYQAIEVKEKRAVKSSVFAEGCSFYKIIMLFFIGAFLGDVIETIFCRLTSGIWMSRSSVVWGPFSIVWGLAISFATLFLFNYREKSDGKIFQIGTILGGVYEYFCSVFTEIVFGKIFWDYSKLPFNLGGRINLLFCFFWGIAAVIWLKKVYPILSSWIEKIPMNFGKVITWILIVFMMVNGFVSASALSRNTERQRGASAQNTYEEWLDLHFDDARMNQIYPNAKNVN